MEGGDELNIHVRSWKSIFAHIVSIVSDWPHRGQPSQAHQSSNQDFRKKNASEECILLYDFHGNLLSEWFTKEGQSEIDGKTDGANDAPCIQVVKNRFAQLIANGKQIVLIFHTMAIG